MKHILSFEYDRQPSKYARLQKSMSHCSRNDWMKKEYLPELESDEIALNFIKALNHPELFESEKDLSKLEAKDLYARVEMIAGKSKKKEDEIKENIEKTEEIIV